MSNDSSGWAEPIRHLLAILVVGGGLAALPIASSAAGVAPPVAAAAAGPGFSASSPDLELVGRLEGETLVLFIDRYASNEPLTGARVELESGDWKTLVAARPDGTYSAPAGPLVRPGSHPLVVTVEAADLADLLQASFIVAPPPPPDPTAPGEGLKHALHYATGTLGGLILAGLGVWVMRRRRST